MNNKFVILNINKIKSLTKEFQNIVNNIENQKELEILFRYINDIKEEFKELKHNKIVFEKISNFINKKNFSDKEIKNLENLISIKDLIRYIEKNFNVSEVYLSELYYYSFKEIINLFLINDLLNRNCKNCYYFDNFYCNLYEKDLTNKDIENSYSCNNYEKKT